MARTTHGEGYKVEIDLDKASPQSVWNQISTSRGLSEWIAPRVDVTQGKIHIFWDETGDDRIGTLTDVSEGEYIQWSWDDHPQSYVRLRVIVSELSRFVSLLVDDHDEHLEPATLRRIWENHSRKLRLSLGLS